MGTVMVFSIGKDPVVLNAWATEPVLGPDAVSIPLGEGLHLYYVDNAHHWASVNRSFGPWTIYGDFMIVRTDEQGAWVDLEGEDPPRIGRMLFGG
jgi:hypothetical protein